MEINAPAIILSATPFGEGDAIVTIFTETHGTWRGLVRGGRARAHAATWQTGNLVEATWRARLADQLGSLTGELVHPTAALAMQNPMALAILLSLCATAEGALPERQPMPSVFRGLLHLIAHNTEADATLPDLILWELGLLQELGYGLDLTACAVTGAADTLAYVSPRTGRAVSADAAGLYKHRLLKLPAFLTTSTTPPTQEDVADALRLTRHFLTRDAFGLLHRPLPGARLALEERVGGGRPGGLCPPGPPAGA